MHELLLFGQVPPTHHSQLLSILAGIAAMQPQPILERHLVFKSARLPAGSPRPGGGPGSILGMADAQLAAFQGQTRGDTYFLRLVGELRVGKDPRRKSGEKEKKEEEEDETQQDDPEKWTLQFRDLPDVTGRRPVISRLMADYQITTNDPLGFMSVLDYTPTTKFHLSGHRLTHLSTTFILSRILIPSPSSSSASSPSTPSSSSRLLDPSGTYTLQVSLRVQDGSKPELMTRGINELLAVREMLRGVVELGVVERLSLDSRVR